MEGDGKVVVIGAGAWGSALGDLLARRGHAVRIWANEPDVVESINRDSENRRYFRSFKLSRRLRAFSDLGEAIRFDGHRADLILFVVPTQFARAVMARMIEHIDESSTFVLCSKGIENSTLALPSEIAEEVFRDRAIESRLVALSGPTFAAELAAGAPTAATLAARSPDLIERARRFLMTDRFRLYGNDDIIGVELSGAYKNALAIATGICDGLKLGFNARAALITRGLAEMRLLGLAKGALERTFLGLAGVGDLVLTSTGALSRNRMVGERLAAGESIDQIRASTQSVAEGVATARSIVDLGARLGVATPIVEKVVRIIYEGACPREAVEELMGRAPVDEFREL